MTTVTDCARIDDYCVTINCQHYIRQEAKGTSITERRKRQARDMIRYRSQIKKMKRVKLLVTLVDSNVIKNKTTTTNVIL
jgi:hypothetical protein